MKKRNHVSKEIFPWINSVNKKYNICKRNESQEFITSSLNPLPHNTTFRRTIDNYAAVENNMRKGEIAACKKQFLLFSERFLPYMAPIFHFKCKLNAVCNFFQFGPV